MRVPSGENAGRDSSWPAAGLATVVTSPPAAATPRIDPPWPKASLLPSGDQAGGVGCGLVYGPATGRSFSPLAPMIRSVRVGEVQDQYAISSATGENAGCPPAPIGTSVPPAAG